MVSIEEVPEKMVRMADLAIVDNIHRTPNFGALTSSPASADCGEKIKKPTFEGQKV